MPVRAVLAAITPPTIIKGEAVGSFVVVFDVSVSTVLVSAEAMGEVPTCW